jgi:quinol monooxygenase YgiN
LRAHARISTVVAGNMREDDMIAIVASFQVQPGKGKEFEAAFGAMMQAVKADEPGNIIYQLVRSRTDPDSYKVLELYKDQAAVDVHGKSDAFKAAAGGIAGLAAGRPSVEFFDAVG